MSQQYQPMPSPIKHPLGLGKLIFMLACLALPVVFYLFTGHPAFIVVFLSGLSCISVYIARLRKKN